MVQFGRRRGAECELTCTYAVMPVTNEVYDEIMHKLQEAGYDHAIFKDAAGRVVLDMHGIALAREKMPDAPT